MTAPTGRATTLAALVLAAALVPVAAGPALAADPGVSVDHDGEAVTVANGTAQVVSGTANAPVGTEVSVRVRSSGDTQPQFIKTANAVVTENGTWAVAFDFSAHAAGDTFALRAATENGTFVTELDGEVVACGGDCADETPDRTPTPRPEQTPTPSPTTAGTPDVELNKGVVVVDRSAVAVMELTLTDTDAATVSVGSAATGYELNATVRDTNDDGRAVLYVDTALAGREGRTVSTGEGDAVTVHAETSLSSTLDAGEYPLAVYAGESAAGDPVTVGTMIVQGEDGDNGSATAADPTPTETPSGGGGLGQSAVALLVSALFLLGGAVVAVVVLR